MYPTKDGRWAGPYSPLNYGPRPLQSFSIKPVKTNFRNRVAFPLVDKRRQYIQEWFPAPYYRIEGDSAIAEYGNDVNELLEIKKQSALAYLYPTKEDTIRKVKLSKAKSLDMTRKEFNQLELSFKKLMVAIGAKDRPTIQSLAFDSVVCSVCEGLSHHRYYNEYEPIDLFIDSAFQSMPVKPLLRLLKAGEFTTKAKDYPITRNLKVELVAGEREVFYTLNFRIKNANGDGFHHQFEFIKVEVVFMFNGMSTQRSYH